MTVDERHLLPYGDTTNDGYVQLSLTLPVPPSARAQEAASLLVRAWGFFDIRIAHQSVVGENHAFFVIFARTEKGIDFTKVVAPELSTQKRSYKEIDKAILKELGRSIRVVGGCTGFDAHTVGLDAIMNMKGFDGDIGLERYQGFKCVNMGSQVPTDVLIDRALKDKADAILLSKIITQKDIHINDMKELIDRLRARGLEGRFVLVVGGPRVTHKMALEIGFDAGFTIGTRPSDVANFLLEQMLKKKK